MSEGSAPWGVCRHAFRFLPFAIGAAVISLVATWPGLTGSWVFDDRAMVGNPLYDDAGDIPRVFVQDSSDYLEAKGGGDTSGARTYRPVTMLTLVATHAVSPSPGPHHVVGWLLHLVTAVLLLVAIRRLDGRSRAESDERGRANTRLWASAVVALLFVLHPTAVEAYVWINGRSDLVAGLLLMAWAVWLLGPRRGRWSDVAPGRVYAAALVAGFAVPAAKETALLPLFALSVAVHLLPGRHAKLGGREWLALGLGAGIYLGVFLRNTLGAVVSFGAEVPIYADPQVWAFAAKLPLIALSALLSCRAGAMQSLSWLAFRPLSTTEWLLGGIALVGLLVFCARSSWSRRALILGAFAGLLPTLVLARVTWLGFDRYLYVATAMLLLAIAGPITDVAQRRPRLMGLLAILLVATCALQSRVASEPYQHHIAWLDAGLKDRPLDPARFAYVAEEYFRSGFREEAARIFDRRPTALASLAGEEKIATVALLLGRPRQYREMVGALSTRFPTSRRAKVHLLHACLLEADIDGALGVAAALDGTAACDETRDRLSGWARAAQGRDPRAAMVEQRASELSCP